MICLPPTPVTMSFRKCAPAWRSVSTISGRSVTSRAKRSAYMHQIGSRIPVLSGSGTTETDFRDPRTPQSLAAVALLVVSTCIRLVACRRSAALRADRTRNGRSPYRSLIFSRLGGKPGDRSINQRVSPRSQVRWPDLRWHRPLPSRSSKRWWRIFQPLGHAAHGFQLGHWQRGPNHSLVEPRQSQIGRAHV